MNPLYLVLGSAVALVIIWGISLEIRFFSLRKRWQTIFAGKEGSDLEKLMNEITESFALSKKEITEQARRLKTVEGFLPQTIQKISTIRYNPFKDTGGDQSFSIAILDGENNGVVISSLFARDGNRIYAKPIEAGASKFELLAEEKEVLKRAVKQG